MWDNDTLLRNLSNAMHAFSVIAMLYGAAYYVMHLPGAFPVRSVRLGDTPQRVAVEQVLQVLHAEVRGNLVTADIEHLRRSLEQLPWVRNVDIRREYPDRLAVWLEEHQVLARWNNTALVNRHGEIFSVESELQMIKAVPRPDEARVNDQTTSQPTRLTYNSNQVAGFGGVLLAGVTQPPLYGGGEQELPGFVGPEGTSVEITQQYAEFKRQLAALNLHAAKLVLSPRHAWQVHLSNSMVLELGREDVQQRLARFVAVYPYSLGAQKIRGATAHVDLRYRNGFAVRWSAGHEG